MSIRKEMMEVCITYCNFCGKDIIGNHTSTKFPDGTKIHFHSQYIGKKNCLQKHDDIVHKLYLKLKRTVQLKDMDHLKIHPSHSKRGKE